MQGIFISAVWAELSAVILRAGWFCGSAQSPDCAAVVETGHALSLQQPCTRSVREQTDSVHLILAVCENRLPAYSGFSQCARTDCRRTVASRSVREPTVVVQWLLAVCENRLSAYSGFSQCARTDCRRTAASRSVREPNVGIHLILGTSGDCLPNVYGSPVFPNVTRDVLS
jgi:hypothetical protein